MSQSTLRFALSAYLLAVIAQTTFIYFLAPLALLRSGSVASAALVFGASAAATILAVVPAGRYCDHRPRREGLRLAFIMIGMGYAAFIIAPLSLWAQLVTAGFVGAGLSVGAISFNSYVADLLAEEGRGRAYGRSGAASVLASAAGPFVAAAVVGVFPDPVDDLRVAALIVLVGQIAAFVLTMRLHSVRTHETPTAFNPNPPGEAALRAIVVLNLLTGLGIGLTAPYYAVHFLSGLELSGDAWGYLLAAATVAGAIGVFLAGRFADTLSARSIVVGGQGLHLVAALAFLAPGPVFLLMAAYVARTLFANAVAPVTHTVLMSRTAAAVRGRNMGWTSLALNLGWGAGAVVGGLVYPLLGGRIFPIGAAFAVSGAVAGFAVLERRLLVRPARRDAAAPSPISGRAADSGE